MLTPRKIHLKIRMTLILLGISLISLFFEAEILRDINQNVTFDMYIFLIPVSLLLFYLSINIKLRNKEIYPMLRVMSVLIYYSQQLAINAVWIVFKALGINYVMHNSLVEFTLIIFCTVIFSCLINVIEKNTKVKFLKYLH